MGWCAIDFCNDVWEIVNKYVPEKDKKKVATKIYKRFRNEDMDDICGDTPIEKYISEKDI
jgi:hypothetical protein